MAHPTIYAFGTGDSPSASEGLVGGKGANLIEMAGLGMPVPPGVVIATTECRLFLSPTLSETSKQTQLGQLADAVIAHFDAHVVPQFGYLPLVSVRSGARVSMPGMMDTLLNVGLTAQNAAEWKARLGVKCYKDCLLRLGDVYSKIVGEPVPVTFREQLMGSIRAVFRSWNSERAKEYRRLHGYPEDWGTAVTVQAMVFGNLNTESCSGVLFTRDPATGDNLVTGEFLPQAQGEDVVAGVRTPRQLYQMEQWSDAALNELLAISETLETHYKEAQDIEFTVQDGKLWILQTRAAKRTAEAAFRIAHDLAVEGMISKAEAVRRVTVEQYLTLLRPRLDPAFTAPALLTGIPASPGVVTGVAVFDPADAGRVANAVLIRKETSPDDFPAMVKSVAILTSTGGATSHAAVVARGINKPAVVGATALVIKGNGAQVLQDGKIVQSILAGNRITLDGGTGQVWVDTDVPVLGGRMTGEARAVLSWATEVQNTLAAYSVTDGAALPESGRVYLSLGALTTPVEFRALLKRLGQMPKLHGVLGFDRPAVPMAKEDLEFLSFLAVEQSQVTWEGKQIPALIKALGSSLLPRKLRSRWRVHLPATASDMQIESVVDLGWSLVRPVRTLADLLSADGPVVIDAEFRARMATEKVDIEQILALLAKTGRAVSEFGRVVDEKDFVNEVLGK